MRIVNNGIVRYKSVLASKVKFDLTPTLVDTALFGAQRRYQIDPSIYEKYSFTKFFDNSYYPLTEKMEEILKNDGAYKFRLSYSGEFYPEQDYYDNPTRTQVLDRYTQIMIEKAFEVTETRTFTSKTYTVLNTHDIILKVQTAILEIEIAIEDYAENGSGWLFRHNNELSLNTFKYRPFRGSSYIPTPEYLKNSKFGLTNIQNDDEYCFAYCIAYTELKPTKNKERVKQYKEIAKKYIDEFKSYYPMKLEDISRFENKFNKTINVYTHKYHNNKISIEPIRTSERIIENYDDCINLLLIKSNDNINIVNTNKKDMKQTQNEHVEKSHYIVINSLSALMYKNNNNNHSHYCPSCLHGYRNKIDLVEHLKGGCLKHKEKTILPTKEKSKDYVYFKNYNKMFKNPFVIYADFESILENVDDVNETNTQKKQKHIPCGYAYKRVCTVDEYDKPLKLYRGVDTISNFVNDLISEYDDVIRILKNIKPIELTKKDEINYQNADRCFLCNGLFNTDNDNDDDDDDVNNDVIEELENKKIDKWTKVRDHDHLTGKYRGPAHNFCNLKYGIRHMRIPVVFHNLKGYDSHFIIKQFKKITNFKIDCIPTSTEKFLSFTIGKLMFIDSCSFIMASLDKLTSSLAGDEHNRLNNIKNKFKHFNNHYYDFNDEQRLLMTQKGIYPYDYMNSFDKFENTEFPSIEECYSQLDKQEMKEDDYDRALKIWKTMNIHNMGEYHDLYLTTDVLLLADVFENFRSMCIDYYSLDPVHYVTLPGFAWDALLKMTGIKLDVFHDYDMYLMIENHIRGGISSIMKRYSEANNKYMDSYDENKDDSYIMYLDANNLYGWSMMQCLPTGNYKFIDGNQFNQDIIMNIPKDNNEGYIFEVDLEYDKDLHDDHNDYPLAPESFEITYDITSNKYQSLRNITKSKHQTSTKLIPNLKDKTKYVVHYRNLQLYLSLGLKLKKIHRVLSFTQQKWMKPYIDFNSNKRKQCKEDFEKDLFILMNNAVFGKTMENVRNRINFELVDNQERLIKIVKEVTFKDSVIINNDLVGVSRTKKTTMLDKPIIIGFSILDLSKELMYDFHYNTIKKNYKNNATLLFTDTDSLCYEIKTHDLYQDFEKIKDIFDFSDYPSNHFLQCNDNKKIPGKFKDESNGLIITDFIGLRAKMYSYKIYQSNDKHNKAKGIKKSVVKKEISYDDYYRCIMGQSANDIMQKTTFNTFRSYNHDM